MGGGEVERNDSGVGSLPSGTARLRRRLRSLHQSHPSHPPSANGDSESLQQHPPVSCWCVDCDQPILPESTNQLSSPQEYVISSIISIQFRWSFIHWIVSNLLKSYLWDDKKNQILCYFINCIYIIHHECQQKRKKNVKCNELFFLFMKCGWAGLKTTGVWCAYGAVDGAANGAKCWPSCWRRRCVTLAICASSTTSSTSHF